MSANVSHIYMLMYLIISFLILFFRKNNYKIKIIILLYNNCHEITVVYLVNIIIMKTEKLSEDFSDKSKNK